jgi:AcrR family transcriptional regulator
MNSNDTLPRRGGRPSQAQSGQIREQILDTATHLFLTQGYGATSIEAIAKAVGMSKRTFYHRFADKAELFSAVVHRLILRMRPAQEKNLFSGGTLEITLRQIAVVILNAALSPEALALHRMIISEALRFPELAAIMEKEGARREAISRIAQLFATHMKTEDTLFAAKQFLQMVIAVPQHRALALGSVMTAPEISAWADKTVHFFLHGYQAQGTV